MPELGLDGDALLWKIGVDAAISKWRSEYDFV